MPTVLAQPDVQQMGFIISCWLNPGLAVGTLTCCITFTFRALAVGTLTFGMLVGTLTFGTLAVGDPPPLKWSDLRYVFDIKEDCNGKEAIQA